MTQLLRKRYRSLSHQFWFLKICKQSNAKAKKSTNKTVEAYSELSRKSTMKHFEKIVNSLSR